MRNNIQGLLIAGALLGLAACKDDAPKARAAAAKNESEVVTNRIAIPAVVRQNLGITFVKVERRRVAKTLRVPGNFEHKASARMEYHAPLGGRVEMLVEQYDDVEKGQALYRIDAPEWRKLQVELAEAELAGAYAGRRLGAGAERAKSIGQEIELVRQRIAQLEKLNAAAGGKASDLADARSRLAGLETQRAQAGEERAQAEMENLRVKPHGDGRTPNARFGQALRLAATWTGLSEEELLENVKQGDGTAPRWKTLDRVEVSAHAHGHIETIATATGGWVKEGESILGIVDHTGIIFRGRGLQSDLGVLRDSQPALIVPPQGGTIDLQDTMEARLQIGIDADPEQRIFDLLLFPEKLAPWARPGVSAHAEVVIDESADEETAIPLSCLMTDGLEKVFFLRDRKKPDEAIRIAADLGVSDGRWVVIRSGVRAGDEVVLDGAYELKLTGAGKAAKGGHFHSDGTFHEAHD